MPPRRAKSKTSSVEKPKSNKKKTSSSSSSSRKKKPVETLDQDATQQQEDFYVNLWGQEVNEDLMQYILDYVPVYPDLLNMRGTNRFWKIKLEKVFFPKIQVLDLLTREKPLVEQLKTVKLKKMASYFPNITKLRVCQTGWECFFQQPNKIETFEFFDLECVAVATGLLDFLSVLMDCHKHGKHPSYLKTVNLYGFAENGYIFRYPPLFNYFNGKHKKKETPMTCLESINLLYHQIDPNISSRIPNLLKCEKPITEYENLVEYWDMLVYQENVNWTLLHPFKIVESLDNEELYDLIIEYAKAQNIPVTLSQFERSLAKNDLLFDEFYKKFVANDNLEPHLRFKMNSEMLNAIFSGGNDHLLNQVIENKDIPLIMDGLTNPLIPLISNGKISLFKKALQREPTLLNLGNTYGNIQGTTTNLNLIYSTFKQHKYRVMPTDTIKYLIDIGVDINYTNSEGSLLNNLLDTNSFLLLPLFENIKMETLQAKDQLGRDTIQNWASRLLKRIYGYSSYSLDVLKFFEKVYNSNGKHLKDYRTSNDSNLLHIISKGPVLLTEYAINTLGIDMTHINMDGIPALHNYSLTDWSCSLIQHVKQDLDVKDNFGKTLLCKTLAESEVSSSILVNYGCDLEYALSNIELASKVFEFKKGEPYINGAKLLLTYALDRSSINYFEVLRNGNLEILKKCLEIEISIISDEINISAITPAHAYLMLDIEVQQIAELGIITRKHYILNSHSFYFKEYTTERDGVVSNVGLAAILGTLNNSLVYDTQQLEQESSITKLNSWMLSVKYGHYEQAQQIIIRLGKSLEECKGTIIELATSNLQYHILEDSLKTRLTERKLIGNDKKLISGFIFNFKFGDFSDLEPFIEDLIDSEVLEQKCITHIVTREQNSELQQFHSNGKYSNSATINFIGKMYRLIHEPVMYQLSMLEVCVLKGYSLKKVQEKLKTDNQIFQFLSRKDRSGNAIIHLLCDCSLPVYIHEEKRELHSYKHSVVVSLLSKLSAALKKQVLNLLNSNQETPIFAAIRSDVKNLVKSLAPNTDMSLRNSQGKTCLEIATPEMSDILIQYADKKTLAVKRQMDEEKSSRKKRK